jgi:mitofusin
VSEALHKEINCLSVLVNEFNLPFDTEQCDLNEYTKKLLHHVEKGLSSKLHESLSIELEKKIKNSEQEVKGNK